jgi:O-antigen/teichoic acid export membrane protein
VASLLKRLAASGAAYQASSLVAGFLALFTLPLYTRHLTRADLGYAETLLTAIILVSILLRFGIGEAFVRFYFDDADPARRDRLARTATSFVLVTTTAAGLAGVAAADAGAAQTLSLAVESALAGDLQASGFRRLEPRALSAMTPIAGIGGAARTRRLSYAAEFELIEPVIPSSGGPIRAVDVDSELDPIVSPRVTESFEVT